MSTSHLKRKQQSHHNGQPSSIREECVPIAKLHSGDIPAKSMPEYEPKLTHEGSGTTARKPRFIAFIGNLPYSTTKSMVEHHFKAVQPISVRVMTDKQQPSKCKGFAFLEFDRYDQMKLCLEKFHHSLFHDGLSAGRKINVELTAGGGGRGRQRKAKLRMKNTKLDDERRRRTIAGNLTRVPVGKEGNDLSMHPTRRDQLK